MTLLFCGSRALQASPWARGLTLTPACWVQSLLFCRAWTLPACLGSPASYPSLLWSLTAKQAHGALPPPAILPSCPSWLPPLTFGQISPILFVSLRVTYSAIAWKVSLQGMPPRNGPETSTVGWITECVSGALSEMWCHLMPLDHVTRLQNGGAGAQGPWLHGA